MSEAETVETETTETPVEDTNDRDAMIKAAEEASSEESGEEKKEEAPKKVEAKPDDEEAPLPKLAAIIKAREKAQKVREESDKVRQEAAQMRAEAEQAKSEYARLREEARQERERLELLKRDPMRAIRELGWDHQDLVNAVLREDQPEWQALSKQEQLMAQMRAELATLREEQQTFAQRRQEEERRAQEAQFQQYRSKVVDTFLGEHASSEKCPHLHTLYTPAEIVAKGDAIADEYKNRTGEVASLAEIAEYLETEAAERAAKLRQMLGGNGHATKSKASGPRALSAASSSERRASPKSIKDMTPEEEYEALKAVASEALRTSA